MVTLLLISGSDSLFLVNQSTLKRKDPYIDFSKGKDRLLDIQQQEVIQQGSYVCADWSHPTVNCFLEYLLLSAKLYNLAVCQSF